MDRMQAPNFTEKSDFPNGGKIIGPAWRAAWQMLEKGEWCNTQELLDAMRAAAPNASGKTLVNLLAQSRYYKITKVRYEASGMPARVRATAYRVVPVVPVVPGDTTERCEGV